MSRHVVYKTPRCSECSHTLRWYRSSDVWKCNYCPATFTKEQAETMYDKPSPDAFDINDLAIFNRQPTPVATSPAVVVAPVVVAPVVTPAVVTPVVLQEPVSCEAPVPTTPIVEPVVEDVEPEPVTTPAFNVDAINEVFCKDEPEPRRGFDINSHPKLSLFNRMPEYHPAPAELGALAGVASRFSLREMK
jgi:hypothetical protein